MKRLFTLLAVVVSASCFAQGGGIADNTGSSGREETVGIQSIDYQASVTTWVQDNQLMVRTTMIEGFNGDLKLYDLNGKVVATKRAQSTTIEMNVSQLSGGVYILEAPLNGERVVKRVFVPGF